MKVTLDRPYADQLVASMVAANHLEPPLGGEVLGFVSWSFFRCRLTSRGRRELVRLLMMENRSIEEQMKVAILYVFCDASN